MQVSGQPDTNRLRRRGRVQFVTGALIVLVLAACFAGITLWALSIRSHTSSEFSKYVQSHNIGQAVLTDDASGFQTDFCVLHLNNAISDQQLRTQTLSLFTTYHRLDGGDHLTLEYRDKNGKNVIEADAVLVDPSHVSLTLHESTGVATSVEALK